MSITGSPLTRAPGLLLVKDTPKGRGVFTSQTIPKGTTIEVSPVLIFTQREVALHTSQTVLQHYTYNWPDPENPSEQTQAIALGLGSMFNHVGGGWGQNVVWTRDVGNACIIYTAHRDIVAGEELCISYGHGRLWFKDADVMREKNGEEELKSRLGQGNDEKIITEIHVSGLADIAVDEAE